MRIGGRALARGVAPEEALAWWFDFTEGNADHAFARVGSRRILERDAATVTMEDRVGFWRETTTARRADRAVAFAGENNLSTFEGVYAFRAAEGGTVIELAASVRPRGVLRAVSLLGKPFIALFIGWDLRHHARDMELSHRAAHERGP